MTAPIELHWVQRPASRPAGLQRPSSIEDAARMLAENPLLRPVAGGTDLLLDMARDGQGRSIDLLDTTGIDGFGDVHIDDGEVHIGASVTHADVLAHPELGANGTLALQQACLEVGSPQLRNRATLAGNVVTASPANDTISALMALGAVVRSVRFSDGELVWRELPLQAFYTGFRSTELAPDELVTRITIPASDHIRRGIWVKAGLRKAQAISVVHAGLVIELDDGGTIVDARIALGSVGPTVALNDAASTVLVGAALNESTIRAAAQAAADSVVPIDDGRATAEYRTASVFTVVSRGLAAIAARTEASRWPSTVPLLSTRAAATRFGQGPVVQRPAVEAGTEIAVEVNGQSQSAPNSATGTLLDWLRDTAGTGTKEGCAEGECGACTVVLDGDAVMSCLVPAAQASGSKVTTVEGLANQTGDGGGRQGASVMQQAFIDTFAVQCGYCIPGFIIAGEVLAQELDKPATRSEVELALSGNLCRCTGYYNIIDAVMTAIESQTPTTDGES